jgi:predicted ATPase
LKRLRPDPSRGKGFVRAIRLVRDEVSDLGRYPFSIPAVAALNELPLDPRVTILVGENGSGKSTLIEAIALAARFGPEGGTRNIHVATQSSESQLHRHLTLVREARREKTGFFLRAESLFNVATRVDELGLEAFGWESLHQKSHGESFLWLLQNRFRPDGLYILDEPEAALSPQRQLSALAIMHDLVRKGCQFVIATHSPILMAYPGALIYKLDETGIAPTLYEETEHYTVTRGFLMRPEAFLKHLFLKDEETEDS